MLCSLTIPRSKLKEVARLMERVIERRNTIPVLAEVKITVTEDGIVTFIGTNLDIEPTITFPPGEIAVTGHATFLLNFPKFRRLAAMICDKVTITLGGDGTVVAVAGIVTITYKHMLPAMDFPNIIKWENEACGVSSMTSEALARVIRLARHCISTEETRYYLNGLWLHRKPNEQSLRAVATDGHRMAMIDSDVVWNCREVIVPSKVVALMAHLCARNPDADVIVKTHDTKHQIQVLIGNVAISAKLIDGTYPDYTRVLPPPSENIKIELTADFLTMVGSAVAQERDEYGGFRSRALSLDPVNKVATYKSPEVDISAPLEGIGDQSIGFNLRYLAEQSRVTPVMTLQSASQNDPGRITSANEPDALWVLMPMRV